MKPQDFILEKTSSVTEVHKIIVRGIAEGLHGSTTYIESLTKILKYREDNKSILSLIDFYAERVKQAREDVNRCSYLPDRQKKEAIGALSSIESVFSQHSISTNWSHLQEVAFNQINERTLFFIYPIIENEFPMPLLTEEDKDFISEEIEKVLSELSGDPALCAYIKKIIDKVKYVSNFYEIIGVEELFEKVSHAYMNIETIREHSSRECREPLKHLSGLLLTIMCSVCGALIFTNDLVESTAAWSYRIDKIAEMFHVKEDIKTLKLPSSKPLLLSPPSKPKLIAYNEEKKE